MSSQSAARRVGVPAWPTLVAVHGTLLLTFAALGALRGWSWSPPAAGVDQQLAALDLPASEAALSEQLSEAIRQAALPEEGVLLPLASSLAARSGLVLLGIDEGALVQAGPVTHVPVTLSLRGDPVDLPVFLGRLTEGPLDVQIHAVAVTAATGRSATATLSLRFSRPTAVPADHIRGLLRESSGAAAAAEPVLLTAAELSAWRAYGSALDAEQEVRSSARRAAFVALTPALASLRTRGGRLAWTPGVPVRLD